MADKHHLFTVTHWLLKAAAIFCVFLVAVLVLAFGVCALAAVGLIHLPIPVEDLKDIKDLPLQLVFVAGAVACASGVFLLALLTLVLLMTARIVKTADQDPFVEDNARRLMQIGWLLVAMQIVGLTAGMIISIVGILFCGGIIALIAPPLIHAGQECARLGDGTHVIGNSTYTCTPTSFNVYTHS